MLVVSQNVASTDLDNYKILNLDSDNTVNRLNCVNETLKFDREKLCATKAKLMSDVDRYKNHILVLK